MPLILDAHFGDPRSESKDVRHSALLTRHASKVRHSIARKSALENQPSLAVAERFLSKHARRSLGFLGYQEASYARNGTFLKLQVARRETLVLHSTTQKMLPKSISFN